MTTATRNTEPPAFYAALRYHVASVANYLRSNGLTGTLRTRWDRVPGRWHVDAAHLEISIPGASEATHDRARRLAADMLREVGFYVGGVHVDGCGVSVTGYYGHAVPADGEQGAAA